jgi:PAS domain-containing protein
MVVYSLGLELTVMLCFWLSLGAAQSSRRIAGRSAFVALAASLAMWCIGRLAESHGLLGPLGSDRIGFAGALVLPVAWVGLTARSERLVVVNRVPWLPAVLLAPSLLLYALLYAGPWGAVFVSYGTDGTLQPGPLWWVSAAAAWMLCTGGSGVLLASALRGDPRRDRLPRLLAGLASLLPVASSCAYVVTGMTWVVDPTPILIGGALVALRPVVFSGGLLAVLPVSQHELIDRLPFGIILTDSAETVVEVNRAAERMLGVPVEAALGRTLHSVLDAQQDVDVQVIDVGSRPARAGRIALVTPSTKSRDRLDP